MFTYFLYHQLYNRSTYAHMINHLTDAKEKKFKIVEEKYFKTVKTKIGTSFCQNVYRNVAITSL